MWVMSLTAHGTEAVWDGTRLQYCRIGRSGGASTATCEFAEIDLRNDDSSSITEFLGKEAIRRRNGALKQLATRGGRHIERVEIVFEHNRDAMQRPTYLACLAFRIQRSGFSQRVGVESDDRVDGRAVLVVSRNAAKINLGELFRCERAFLESRLKIANSGSFYIHFGGPNGERENKSGSKS